MTKVFEKVHVDIQDVVNSKKWFNTQVANIARARITPNNVIGDKGLSLTFRIQPGSMYFFRYDPKFKDTLPYYDTFPLVIPYNTAPGGFIGLNMHYLDYQNRYKLFKKLLDLNGRKLDERTKIKYSWATVSAFANTLNVDKCIKHYLYEHLASPLAKVKQEDYMTALMLPVEKFVGQTKQYIWTRN